MSAPEFPSPDEWELSLADGRTRRLDSDLELLEDRKLIALVSVREDLRVLFAGRDDLAEVTLGPDGATKMVRTEEQLGPFTAGIWSRGCVARAADGTVTISLPIRRAGPDTRDGRGGLQTGTLTVRYPNARLPNGADADPSLDGRCVEVPAELDPEGAQSPFELWLGWWGEHPVRATRLGGRQLVVYQTPLGGVGNAAVHIERR